MGTPLVSVVIPAYNHGRFIDRTLASVFAQDYPNIEVTVVNDGSVDNTSERLRAWLPRITLLEHPRGRSRGPAATLNEAIRNSRGEFVAFLDSDDIWYPTKLSRQVAALRDHSAWGLVYCNGYGVSPDDVPDYLLLPPGHHESADGQEILLNCYIATPSSVMIRRSVLEDVGLLNERLQYAHDHDLYIKIRERAGFGYIPEPLMGYRRHPQQHCTRREMWEWGFGVLRDACRRYPYGFTVRRKRWAVLRYRLGEHDWLNGRKLRALGSFALAALADPSRAAHEAAARLRAGRGFGGLAGEAGGK